MMSNYVVDVSAEPSGV